MGVQRGEGSLYVGPHGIVSWLREPNRPANNFQAMYAAAWLWNLAYRVDNPELETSPPDPDPSWAPYGDLRVMAWNGGKADTP